MGIRGHLCRSGRAKLRELFNAVIDVDRVAVRSVQSFVRGVCSWDHADYFVTPRESSRAPWLFRQIFCRVREDGDWLVNACVAFTLPQAR